MADAAVSRITIPVGGMTCAACQAPVIGLSLASGGIIKVCSRNGCRHHSLEFEDSRDALELFRNQDASGLF